MSVVEKCETCAFWIRSECHRKAPGGPYPYEETAIGLGGLDGTTHHCTMTMVSLWPHTKPDDFCGEWELKDAGERQ